MEDYDFNKAKKSCSSPPVDNVGYISSVSILKYTK